MKQVLIIIMTIALNTSIIAQSTKNILFIHGAWSNSEAWENFESFFESEGYKIYTPNLRFHDKKTDSLKGVSMFDYISDMEKIIASMDSKPTIIAHSMGCIIAQKLAEKNLVDKLILIGTPISYGMMPPKTDINAVEWIGKIKKLKHKIVKPSFEQAKLVLFNNLDSLQQVAEYEKLTFESGQVMKEMIWIKNIFGKKPNKIKYSKIASPTLLIYGGKDLSTPKEIGNKLIKKMKTNVDMKVFDNNAHWMIKENNWNEIAEYILYWI